MIQTENQKNYNLFGRYTCASWAVYSFVLLGVYAIVILMTFLDYGLTVDEPPLLNYGHDIIRWYQSGFTYEPIFETTNTWLYGGLVHVLGYLLGQVLPLSPYEAYHLCCAVIGFTGAVAAYRIGTLLGGGPAGFLAVLFLILTPRYYGHVFNNPKDIPFAVFYLWSLFWIIRGIGHLPNLPRHWLWKTGLAIGLTLACRVNGLVLFFYLGLFWGIRYLFLIYQGTPFSDVVRKFIIQMGVIVIVAYAVMLPFWPWGLLHPVTGPFKALGYFSQFLEPHFSFFDCQYVLNHDVPWDYVSKWLLLTLPEFVILGLIFGVVRLGMCRVRRFSDLKLIHIQRVALIWGVVFPVVYAAVMQTPFYDGYRHVLFVVPPLVICSAIGVWDCMQRLSSVVQRVFMFGMIGLVGWVLVYMVRIHPNQSLYFNHAISGGIQQASVCYETDYWGNSYKQGLDWIAEHYTWDFSKRKLRVASRFGQLHNVMDRELFERVEVYEDADLYLGTTRFDHHRLTPGEIVHTVLVDDTPVLYVIRPDSNYQDDPFFATSPFRRMYLNLKFDGAAAEEERALFFKQVEDQNLQYFLAGAYNNLAMQQHQAGHYEPAVRLYEEALRVYPQHLTAMYNYGQALFQQDRFGDVIALYKKAFDYRAENILDKEAIRNMYATLGQCYRQIGQREDAVEAFESALVLSPNASHIAYQLASVYLDQEDYVAAYDHLHLLVNRYPEQIAYRLDLAIALVKQDSLNTALLQCEKIVQISPTAIEAYMLMGQIYQAVGDVALAKVQYQKALAVNPDHEALLDMIQSLEK